MSSTHKLTLQQDKTKLRNPIKSLIKSLTLITVYNFLSQIYHFYPYYLKGYKVLHSKPSIFSVYAHLCKMRRFSSIKKMVTCYMSWAKCGRTRFRLTTL